MNVASRSSILNSGTSNGSDHTVDPMELLSSLFQKKGFNRGPDCFGLLLLCIAGPGGGRGGGGGTMPPGRGGGGGGGGGASLPGIGGGNDNVFDDNDRSRDAISGGLRRAGGGAEVGAETHLQKHPRSPSS